MVVDAVGCEPVSNLKFPANREINREFRQIGGFQRPKALISAADSSAYRQIPYSSEQGIFFARTGIDHGIILAKQGIQLRGNWESITELSLGPSTRGT
jgi:hypothetical protein